MRTDADLEAIYKEGYTKDHATGLRAVYDAGQNHDAFAAEERRRTEDEQFNERVRVEKGLEEAKLVAPRKG